MRSGSMAAAGSRCRRNLPGRIQRTLFALESMGVFGLTSWQQERSLGVRLRAEFRGERLSDAPAARKRNESDSRWLIDGSGPIAAVIEKELRTIPLIHAICCFHGVAAFNGSGR